MRTPAHPLLLFLAAAGSAGCAEVRLREPVVVREEVLQTRHELVVGHDAHARMTQAGSKVQIVAARSCSVHALRDVQRTVRTQRYNANAGGTTALGVAGGAFLAAGGTLIALPYTHARVDRAADLGVGIPLAAVGVTLAAAAVGEALRASGSEERIEVAVGDDRVAVANAPCKQLPSAATDVAIEGSVAGDGGARVPLGRTDVHGRLELDLTTLPAAVWRGAPESMTLFMGDAPIGTVSLREAAATADEQAWARADGSACEAAGGPGACDSLQRYLEVFPSGRRAAEAREVLALGQAKIRARADLAAEEAAHRERAAERARADAARKAAQIEAASVAARRAAAAQCRVTCTRSCGGARGCVDVCVERSCD